MRQPATAMVFAAGRGTRMRDLVRDRPKAVIEVAGRPLIDHALEVLEPVRLRRTVVNVHHMPAPLVAHLDRLGRADIVVSDETEELLETGGGIKAAAQMLGDDPIATLNADAVWDGPAPALTLTAASAGVPAHVRCCLLLVPRDRAVGHLGQGDFFLDPEGRPVRRGEAPTAPYVYTGLQIIDPLAVYDWPERVFSLNRIWDRLLAADAVRATIFEGSWCDVGHPDSLPLAEAMIAR